MMWKLFQIVVFLSVSFTGIYYEWTPNGFVLGLVALMATAVATAALGEFFRLVRWSFKRVARASVDQNPDDRLLSRRRNIS